MYIQLFLKKNQYEFYFFRKNLKNTKNRIILFIFTLFSFFHFSIFDIFVGDPASSGEQDSQPDWPMLEDIVRVGPAAQRRISDGGMFVLVRNVLVFARFDCVFKVIWVLSMILSGALWKK